jgi:mannose-6-phosphate isomerase-like protein (cupin superfamily)
MKVKNIRIIGISAALIAAASVPVIAAEKSAVVAKADLKWKNLGTGVSQPRRFRATWRRAPAGFFSSTPVGFVTPNHHHTADHYVTVVSGTITLTVDGKDHKLGPGSYFALTQKKPHTAKVEGNEDAVFFIQADGPWDVVMEK